MQFVQLKNPWYVVNVWNADCWNDSKARTYIYIYTHIYRERDVDVDMYIYIYIYTHWYINAERGLSGSNPGPKARGSRVRVGESTGDGDTVGSNCSIENYLSNFNQIISSKNSNCEIWARWGFPTESCPLLKGFLFAAITARGLGTPRHVLDLLVQELGLLGYMI